MQTDLLEGADTGHGRFDLGRGYSLHLPRGPRGTALLYHQSSFSKRVNLADKAERRIFVIELLQKNLNQTRLAEVLNVSRQTLHNYRESYRMFGVTGLLHGYSPSSSISQELQGRLHVSKRRPGSKARELEALGRAQKSEGVAQDELAWDGEARASFKLEESPIEEVLAGAQTSIEVDSNAYQPTIEEIPNETTSTTQTMSQGDLAGLAAAQAQASPDMAGAPATLLPFADNHAWQASRYAGIFPVLMVLMSQGQWMQRLLGLFGNAWHIFHVFALMALRNIRSIEQLKHERREEAGRILGFGTLPGRDKLWSWFYEAANMGRSAALLKSFFAHQIKNGAVGLRLWFTDDHLLPYTGQDKVHAAWSTQRSMPMPGQTNLVTCDEKGRVVYFEIQEGKGDLRAQILKLGEYARGQSLGMMPVQVFDREGNGMGFFSELVRSRTPFITWEKNANQVRLDALPEADFTHTVSVNATEYRLLEETKACTYHSVADPDSATLAPVHHFNLRRVVAWNQRTGHRVSVLCWDDGLGLSQEEVASGMLSRWGASENTFKHIQDRHPYHYRPGFSLSESEKQDIVNPQIKVLAQTIASVQAHLAKLYKKHTKTKPIANKDGSERTNSLHRRLTQAIAVSEAELKRLQSDKAQLPERIDVKDLADYRCFKTVDNEGKNLFDFVTSSVWNARRQLLDWLVESYASNNDRVDLLYAIFNCQGWIRSDEKWVVVRLEPLQQPARRYAQEQLCRKLIGLGARIPGGKWLRVEVGETPL